jgi:hypothetical protein
MGPGAEFPCGAVSRIRLPSPVAMGEGPGMRVERGDCDAPVLPIPPPFSRRNERSLVRSGWRMRANAGGRDISMSQPSSASVS